MANALYPIWKEQLLQFTANNSLSTGNVKAALINVTPGGYTYATTHQFWANAAGNVVGTPQTINSKTFATGTFNGAGVTYTSLTGAAVQAVILYVDTGVASTSPLVAYIDTGVTGLPVTPNGGNVTVTWNVAGIFSL